MWPTNCCALPLGEISLETCTCPSLYQLGTNHASYTHHRSKSKASNHLPSSHVSSRKAQLATSHPHRLQQIPQCLTNSRHLLCRHTIIARLFLLKHGLICLVIVIVDHDLKLFSRKQRLCSVCDPNRAFRKHLYRVL